MLKSAFSVFLFSCLLERLDCTVQTETVKEGENATLHCYGPTDATIILLRWEKPDQQSERYVFYVRNGRPNENYQLPHFKGRVKLKDPEMKNGDFTVNLTNVSMNDTGTYKCHAGDNNQKLQLLNSINLTVEEPGQTGGQKKDGGKEDEVKEDGGKEDGGEKRDSVGLKVGLSVVAVFVFVVIVCCIIFRKRLNQSISNYRRPAHFEMVPVSPAAVPGSQQSVQHSSQ